MTRRRTSSGPEAPSKGRSISPLPVPSRQAETSTTTVSRPTSGSTATRHLIDWYRLMSSGRPGPVTIRSGAAAPPGARPSAATSTAHAASTFSTRAAWAASGSPALSATGRSASSSVRLTMKRSRARRAAASISSWMGLPSSTPGRARGSLMSPMVWLRRMLSYPATAGRIALRPPLKPANSCASHTPRAMTSPASATTRLTSTSLPRGVAPTLTQSLRRASWATHRRYAISGPSIHAASSAVTGRWAPPPNTTVTRAASTPPRASSSSRGGRSSRLGTARVASLVTMATDPVPRASSASGAAPTGAASASRRATPGSIGAGSAISRRRTSQPLEASASDARPRAVSRSRAAASAASPLSSELLTAVSLLRVTSSPPVSGALSARTLAVCPVRADGLVK